MKNKPINFGQRYYIMADSVCNYVLSVVADNLDRGVAALPTAIPIIFDKLCKVAALKEQSLVVPDNYYSTTVLLQYLYTNFRLFYLGTLRSNRLTIDVPSIDEFTYGHSIAGTLRLPYSYNSCNEYTIYRCLDINKFPINQANGSLVSMITQ